MLDQLTNIHPGLAQYILGFLSPIYIGIFRALCKACDNAVRDGRIRLWPILARDMRASYLNALCKARNKREIAHIISDEKAARHIAAMCSHLGAEHARIWDFLCIVADEYKDVSLIEFIHENNYSSGFGTKFSIIHLLNKGLKPRINIDRLSGIRTGTADVELLEAMSQANYDLSHFEDIRNWAVKAGRKDVLDWFLANKYEKRMAYYLNVIKKAAKENVKGLFSRAEIIEATKEYINVMASLACYYGRIDLLDMMKEEGMRVNISNCIYRVITANRVDVLKWLYRNYCDSDPARLELYMKDYIKHDDQADFYETLKWLYGLNINLSNLVNPVFEEGHPKCMQLLHDLGIRPDSGVRTMYIEGLEWAHNNGYKELCDFSAPLTNDDYSSRITKDEDVHFLQWLEDHGYDYRGLFKLEYAWYVSRNIRKWFAERLPLDNKLFRQCKNGAHYCFYKHIIFRPIPYPWRKTILINAIIYNDYKIITLAGQYFEQGVLCSLGVIQALSVCVIIGNCRMIRHWYKQGMLLRPLKVLDMIDHPISEYHGLLWIRLNVPGKNVRAKCDELLYYHLCRQTELMPIKAFLDKYNNLMPDELIWAALRPK